MPGDAGDRQQAKDLARIAIDRGGTFTDAICSRPGKKDIVIKVSRACLSGRTVYPDEEP